MTVKKYLDPDFEAQRQSKQQFYLFGEHISKSRAPFLHNTLFELLKLDWNYKLFESSDFDAFNAKFDGEKLIGSAVTMPNKVKAVEHVDELDSIGRGCGSINTIYTRIDPDTQEVKKIGTNTDTVGIENSFLMNYPEQTANYANLPGLVYGGGGACRSAVYALYTLLNVSKVYIINRFASEVDDVRESMIANGFKGEIIHVSTPEQAKTLESPKLVVLTVPNFAPQTKEELQAKATLDVFKNQKEPGLVLEMCYHPIIETFLYKEFEKANWTVISGVEAMIYQGVAQQVLWTGIPLSKIPVQEVCKILYDSIKKEQEEEQKI